MLFEEIIKTKELLKALKELNIEKLTIPQEEIYKNYNKKQDILLTSKTGSGKTLAYILPILDNYLVNRKEKELALTIIVPTNELIYQIHKVLKQITKYIDLQIMIFDKNLDNKKAEEKLKNDLEIVIGTPKKLHLYAKTYNLLKIYKTKNLVIDEADMVFFEDDLELYELLDLINAKKIFLSATFNKELQQKVKKILYNPIYLKGDTTDLNIKHYFINTRDEKREETLKQLLETFMPYICLIFAKKDELKEISNVLNECNKNFIMVSNELDIRKRKQIIKDILQEKYEYIITTDVIARGIDINNVSHIINYSLPMDYEFYIHRQGRTARMGKSGIIYTLYDHLDNNYLDNLEKKNVIPTYVKIKDKEITPAKKRDERESRKNPKDYLSEAYKRIKKEKVKPGYKKKRREEALKLSKKLKGR